MNDHPLSTMVKRTARAALVVLLLAVVLVAGCARAPSITVIQVTTTPEVQVVQVTATPSLIPMKRDP